MQLTFRRLPREARIFAEAQAFLDDGVDLATVLAFFPAEAAWLEPALDTSAIIGGTYAAEEPSFYFEASLKTRFLAAAKAGSRPQPAFAGLRLRTAGAALTVAAAAAALGVVTLGITTSQEAVPGDWNYTFKIAEERVRYNLSRGDQRVDVQFRNTEARVFEIQRLSSRGDVSAGDLASLQREADQLASLARNKEFDDVQKQRAESLREITKTVLSDVATKQTALQPTVNTTLGTVDTAVAAATGGTTALTSPTPSPTPSPTASPAATSTASPSATPVASPSPTATAEPTATATAEPSTTPSPSPAASPPPAPSATPSPSPSATGTASPAPSATNGPAR